MHRTKTKPLADSFRALCSHLTLNAGAIEARQRASRTNAFVLNSSALMLPAVIVSLTDLLPKVHHAVMDR